ncbi:MAG TPA: glucose 1-dehydrogenase [Caulifigura sp.]|jgi:3-oxoacyl-[acyl-carrier protein] reductase|nr:glucose 1-dehydrogenase [Caulifigura sp.]
MSQKLSGKVAVVTGASKGIGAEIAAQLAAEGAAVVVNYSSSKDAADRVVARIKEAGGKAVAVHANLSQPADAPKLFAEAKKAFGKVDILVNNAGIYEFSPIGEITVDHYKKQFDLNVLGLILATQEAVKLIPAEGGSIINVSSVVSTGRFPNAAVYSGTKGAVDAITRSLAAELGPRKIRVNTINPGMVETEGTHGSGITESDMRKQVEAATPLGRIGKVTDIAPAVVYLAGPDSVWVTGESFYLSGGSR